MKKSLLLLLALVAFTQTLTVRAEKISDDTLFSRLEEGTQFLFLSEVRIPKNTTVYNNHRIVAGSVPFITTCKLTTKAEIIPAKTILTSGAPSDKLVLSGVTLDGTPILINIDCKVKTIRELREEVLKDIQVYTPNFIDMFGYYRALETEAAEKILKNPDYIALMKQYRKLQRNLDLLEKRYLSSSSEVTRNLGRMIQNFRKRITRLKNSLPKLKRTPAKEESYHFSRTPDFILRCQP